jgi:hypothetical protein
LGFDLTTTDMAKNSKRKKNKNKGITDYGKKKNMVTVSMEDLAPCWCRGVGIGCGKFLSRSSRLRHARKERKLREEGKRNIMRWKQHAHSPPDSAVSSSGSSSLSSRFLDALNRPEASHLEDIHRDSRPGTSIPSEAAAGMEIENVYDDWGGMDVEPQDTPNAAVEALFDMELSALGDMREWLAEEDEEERNDDEEEEGLVWDQVRVAEDADAVDILRRADDQERRVMEERMLLNYGK